MNKHLLSLTLIVLLGLLGGYLLNQQGADQGLPERGPLLPELAEQGNAIQSIRVQNAQQGDIQAKLQDGQWVLASTFPADAEKLAELVQALVDAQKLQQKTANAEYFHRLGLQDIEVTDSVASLLTIDAANQRWQVLVGNVPASGHGRYVRMAGDEQSWLIDKDLDIPVTELDWMRQPILDVSKDEVTALSRTDEPGWSMVRNEQSTEFELAAMPTGRGLKYAAVLSGVVSNLVNLHFEQVQAWDASLWQSYTPVADFSLQTNSKGQINIQLAQAEGRHFVHFNQESEESEPAYWQRWIFQISDFSAGQLNKVLEDFLAEPPAPQDKLPVSNLDEGQ
ncbi:DUF4340 domain-containing protein [Aliiglaciecola sp. CAU 1673]|uniref:DUF4340 domain-containing protein n=1 Tax=Aliiglaciecola sp. CAU 1673 TaxID=3032595 RepID=UPI0023DA1A5D|nr:DUF4340 domain-containing protein [Aliiglaciecola sp. CAU 1673]MDF2179598.1 DUF4340 domain-containing protein [Aliiglaciecola sp. CAU 1673]